MVQLSICIATLNRAAFIGQTLDSILSQMNDDVELVIVDGASSDETERVVGDRLEGRVNCVYHRLPEKGGVDKDYARAAALARGAYIWFMTDDDLLCTHAIATILEHLRSEPDLLVVNVEVLGPDLQTRLTERKLVIDADCEFPAAEQAGLLALAGDLLSFIGAVVIRRAAWESRAAAPYFGTEFIHVGVIFQRPLERPARVLAAPLIRIRYGNALWTPRAFEIWMFKWPRLIWSFTHLPEAAREAVTAREPWRRLVPILMMKARGCYTLDTYRRNLADLPLSWWTRLRLAMLAAFPDVLLNAALSVVVPVLVPRAKGTLVDLRQSPFDYRKVWLGRS
ncbi:MAG: glycosyltransferase family 2 protein [Gemmataceae bacterium]|nr:glycosyltransferase family 2 protein [Gemmataceae bacterium]